MLEFFSETMHKTNLSKLSSFRLCVRKSDACILKLIYLVQAETILNFIAIYKHAASSVFLTNFWPQFCNEGRWGLEIPV